MAGKFPVITLRPSWLECGAVAVMAVWADEDDRAMLCCFFILPCDLFVCTKEFCAVGIATTEVLMYL